MNIVLFAHPAFMSSQSMPRFATWIADGMKKRGHTVTVIRPKGAFYNLPIPGSARKWMGYVDQYLLFPSSAKRFARKQVAEDTLFVFADNALGPWVPLVADRPHAIHCHDFLAQNGALGNIAELNTSWTGKQYQDYIRRGLGKGRNFICISEKTRADLLELPGIRPDRLEVVYNGLTRTFEPAAHLAEIRRQLSGELKIDVNQGFFFHIGGNQWYKNKKGVIGMYEAWRASSARSLPLLMMGDLPETELSNMVAESTYRRDIHFIKTPSDTVAKAAFQTATALLFPSLAEGFGWPIAEAMASGSLVITTDEAPMNEVGGSVALYVTRMPEEEKEQKRWAEKSALVLERAATLDSVPGMYERNEIINAGLRQVEKFNGEEALDQIESIYFSILNK